MENPIHGGEPITALRRRSPSDGRPEPAAERRMISSLLHEISTPLTVIQGFSELIRDEALSPAEIQEYAADISREATHLMEVIIRTREQHRQMVEASRKKEHPT